MRLDQTKKPGWFRTVVLGDVHLGNPYTPTDYIIRNLHTCINAELIKEIDLLVIEGDLFDRLLSNNDDNVYRIHAWATWLMCVCAEHNTALFVLEGTPSHDWQQNKYFVEQKQNANIPVDLHYAKTLSIEYFEKWDMHVLFVPDKCRPHTDDIRDEVKVLLANKGLDKVDLAIMHGAFRYQLPDIAEEPTHDERTYLDIVKYFIFIGHVHQSSQYERILAAGSFDRHTHGDEGIKGFYDVSFREDGTNRITFVENKYAKRYDTIDCHGLDIKAINVKVLDKINKIPRKSSIRLRCNRNDPAVNYVEVLKREFPDFEWANPVVESNDTKKKASVTDILATLDMSSFIPITSDSLRELLKPEIERHAKDAATVERCLKHVETLLEV